MTQNTIQSEIQNGIQIERQIERQSGYSLCRMHNADGEATPTGTGASLGPLSRHGFSQRAVPQPSDQSCQVTKAIVEMDLPAKVY